MASDRDEQFVYIDAETFGLDKGCEVFEIGMIKDGQETILWVPADLSKADPESLRINGYYERRKACEEKYKVTGEEAAWKIAEVTSRCTLLGIVPSFDEIRVGSFMKKHGIPPAWNYWTTDVVTFGAGAVGLSKNATAKAVSVALGVTPPGPDEVHTAIGDARWAKRIYEGAIQVTSEEYRKRDLEQRIVKIFAEERDFYVHDQQEVASRWASKLASKVSA